MAEKISEHISTQRTSDDSETWLASRRQFMSKHLLGLGC
jgi:hypothetical protein